MPVTRAFPLRGQIGWLVDRMHVGTAPEAVAADIRRRLPAAWSPADIDSAIRYALRRHATNGGQYRRVMGGF